MASELQRKIVEDLKGGMKSGDTQRVSCLRLLQSQIRNEEIALRVSEISEEDVQRILQREVKKRKEAAAAFESAGRLPAAQQEKEEGAILETYLPAQLSEEDILAVIEQVRSELFGSGTPHAGKMTGAVMAKVRGKADGARVKELVERVLSST